MAKRSITPIEAATALSLVLITAIICRAIYNAVVVSEPKRIPPPRPMKKRRG
tara:strand:- start:8279 stop:8434 length:156 start_codon:yes stop_codon:yes gene_type:complete